ncbi:MAG: hypothetical protein F6K28_54700 [Microcoleus sp. SIO2G3]|nr:hypothetical protein [Microcoleus sp. SIO2G3]
MEIVPKFLIDEGLSIGVAIFWGWKANLNRIDRLDQSQSQIGLILKAAAGKLPALEGEAWLLTASDLGAIG